MPKILLIIGDAAEDLEVMYPYQRWRRGTRCKSPHRRRKSSSS